MVLTMTNKIYSTFFSGHFLFDKCTWYGKVPEIVSVDLYQSLYSFIEAYGNVPNWAYIPVEITFLPMIQYSYQSLALTNLRDISW